MDFSFFDASYDGVFVLNKDNGVVYCNESAAQLCASSVRRLSKVTDLFTVIQFENPEILSQTTSWTEIKFDVVGKSKSGTVQVASQPFSIDEEELRILTLHDVTLEETLHRKYQGELEQKENVINELRQAQAQLESYSKNLEKMVEERAGQLKAANQMLSAIMDSLGQGFLVFNSEGVCSSIFTRACVDILEVSPAGRDICDVLGLRDDDLEQFKNWMKIAFAESLPFESLKDLAPQVYSHSEGKYITLDYFPIRNEAEGISDLVLVATDKTVEYETNIQLENERAFAKMILKAVSSREQFAHFLSATRKTICHVRELVTGFDFDKDLVFRILHTLEGEAGAFSVEEIRVASRVSQEYLQKIRAEEHLKLFHESLNSLEASYESFLEKNSHWLKAIKIGEEPRIEVPEAAVRDFYNTLSQSSQPSLAVEFEEKVMREPLVELLSHIDQLAQGVALKQGKQLLPVQFNCNGIRVNPFYWDRFLASLVHVVRNAVDHGLEEPDERETLGKAPKGKIAIATDYLNAEKTWVRMEISDDGRGIDPDVLYRKAIEKIPGLNIEHADQKAILQLVFHPGFSSRDEVGEFSGRGVGMDAVHSEVHDLGGRVWVESIKGDGCRFIFELPLVPEKASLAKAA